MTSLRLLCLHGKQQNSEVLRMRLGRVPYKCRNSESEFDIIEAPHDLPLKKDDSVSYKTWFFKDSECHAKNMNYENPSNISFADSIEMSLKFLERKWHDKIDQGEGHGYDGLLGFSQGGTMAAYITNFPERFPGIQFLICIGAPDLPLIKGNKSLHSLHLAGKTDTIVTKDMSASLSLKFDSPLIEHGQGHCIPSKAVDIEHIVNFLLLQKQIKMSSLAVEFPITTTLNTSLSTANTTSMTTVYSIGSKSTITQSAAKEKMDDVCVTDDYALQHHEELEALLAIYPDDVIIERPVSTHAGAPTGVFSVRLTVSLENCQPPMPSKWINQLRLKFNLTSCYPDIVPKISLNTGTDGSLSLVDFPLAVSSSLLAAVRREAEDNVGVCSALACIQRAQEWLSTGGWLHSISSSSVSTSSSLLVTHSLGGGTKDGSNNAVKEAESDSSTAVPWYMIPDSDYDSVIEDNQELVHGTEGRGISVSNRIEEEKERIEKQMIEDATFEASSLACRIQQQSGSFSLEASLLELGRTHTDHSIYNDDSIYNDEIDDTNDPQDSVSVVENNSFSHSHSSTSTRGVWHYTVGLIGKPSAGKSTFYNAVTRAALDRDGRKLGKLSYLFIYDFNIIFVVCLYLVI